jgi:hypothetical protein
LHELTTILGDRAMAHSLVLVLIHDPQRNVVEQVDAVLERHSEHAAVEPFKDYFAPAYSGDRLWQAQDADEFVRWRERAYGEKWERDEKGYYRWIDSNPDSHYDWYTLGGRWDGIFAGLFEGASPETDIVGGRVDGNVCPVAALPSDLFPNSIVTPDGQWHFFGWRLFGDTPDAQGLEMIRGISERFGTCYAVAVDAHS